MNLKVHKRYTKAPSIKASEPHWSKLNICITDRIVRNENFKVATKFINSSTYNEAILALMKEAASKPILASHVAIHNTKAKYFLDAFAAAEKGSIHNILPFTSTGGSVEVATDWYKKMREVNQREYENEYYVKPNWEPSRFYIMADIGYMKDLSTIIVLEKRGTVTHIIGEKSYDLHRYNPVHKKQVFNEHLENMIEKYSRYSPKVFEA